MQDQPNNLPFGTIMKRAMEYKGLSGNFLAKVSGISEPTIRKLLKIGLENSVNRPELENVLAVCKVLEIDFSEAIRSIYGIDIYASHSGYSIGALAVARLYDQLSTEKKESIDNLINTYARQEGLHEIADNIATIEQLANQLKANHHLFGKQRPRPLAKAVWSLSRLTPNANYSAMLRMLVDGVHFLFEKTEPSLVPTSEDELIAIINHPDNVLLLNMLIADAGLRSPLERIYWLFFIWTDYSTQIDKFNLEQQEALRNLWRSLYELKNKASQDK